MNVDAKVKSMPKVLGISSSPRLRNSHALYDSLSSVMLQGVLETVGEISGLSWEAINLSQLNLHPCRGCFSDVETRCHFLCDCYDDDFKNLALKMISADAIILATPTYMFGMSSVLKRFLERWISFKAPPIEQAIANKSLDECYDLLEKLKNGTLKVSNPLQGKIGAIVVAGSELGQDSIIKEIMLTMNLYGFVFPPQAFIYHTGHSMQSLEDVRIALYENKWLALATENLAHNIVHMIQMTAGATWHEMPKTFPE